MKARFIDKVWPVKISGRNAGDTVPWQSPKTVIFEQPVFVGKSVDWKSANATVSGNSWRIRLKCFRQFSTGFDHTTDLQIRFTKTRSEVWKYRLVMVSWYLVAM